VRQMAQSDAFGLIMLGKLSIMGAVAAILMIPTALGAQMRGAVNRGVHVGGAVSPGATVRGAVERGIPVKSFLWFVHEVNIASIVNDDRGRGAELEHRALALRAKLAELRVRQDQTFELMEKTKAIDFVAKKLDELEEERASLEDELRAVEAERAGLNASRHDLDEIRPMIERLRGAGDDAHRLRSAVTSRLRTIVDSILVAAAGDAPKTEKTIAFLRDQPDTEAIIEHVEVVSDRRSTSPPVFKSGSFRMVRVNDDDPTNFEMVLTREEGMLPEEQR
jgi:hypothetical protein